MDHEDFFGQPRAADLARALVWLVDKGGSCSLREWEFHLGYSSRVAAEIHEQMQKLGLLVVTRVRPDARAPVRDISVTKEGEETGRALAMANAPFNRALAKARGHERKRHVD